MTSRTAQALRTRPEVRDLAASHNIRVLNKPLRPAALRALLSQWRVTRGAAK